MKIEQAPHTFFDSKEEYLQFRQAWKDFHKDGKHKKKPTTDYCGGVSHKSELTCAHHLIYALLRGRDITKSFVPNRKVHGQDPYFAYYNARQKISFSLRMLENHSRGDMMAKLLLPFGGLVSTDMLETALELTKDWKFADG